MARNKGLKELLRIDLREKYRDTLFSDWEGRDLSAQHRFIPAPQGVVRMSFTHPAPCPTRADRVIESFDGGEEWEENDGWSPPVDRGMFVHGERWMALRGGIQVWRTFGPGARWEMRDVRNADESLYEGLGVPNCFSAIMCTKGLNAGRILMVSSYFTGQEGPDCELISSTYSDDWGDTWHCSRLWGPPDPLPHVAEGFGEPAVVEMPSGWLWMVFRSEYGELWQSVSRDGGASWGRPSPTGFVSPIANCYAMREPSTGATVLCWNAAQPGTDADFTSKRSLYRPRTNLVFSVSHDNTRTWTEPVVVEPEGGQYPTIHFAAGRMFIMYQSSPGAEHVPWYDLGLTLVAYDTNDVLALPRWTAETIKPWIDRGLVRHWRAMAYEPANRRTIT